jgi:hypothetical protein
LASFDVLSFSAESFDFGSFDLDAPPDVGGGTSSDGTSGGVGGGGGRAFRVGLSGAAYYPKLKRDEVAERLKAVEAEIRRKEAEERALMANEKLAIVESLQDKMKRLEAALVALEIEREALRTIRFQQEQVEMDEALAAYEQYRKWKR